MADEKKSEELHNLLDELQEVVTDLDEAGYSREEQAVLESYVTIIRQELRALGEKVAELEKEIEAGEECYVELYAKWRSLKASQPPPPSSTTGGESIEIKALRSTTLPQVDLRFNDGTGLLGRIKETSQQIVTATPSQSQEVDGWIIYHPDEGVDTGTFADGFVATLVYEKEQSARNCLCDSAINDGWRIRPVKIVPLDKTGHLEDHELTPPTEAQIAEAREVLSEHEDDFVGE